MKSIDHRARALITGVAFLVALLPAADAFAKTTQRSLAEFIDAQGTLCIDDGAGGCVLFVPPAANFIGFTDTVNDLGISVDYAGLADDALAGILGTSFSGKVTERTLSDGRALITVQLRTENALTWVIPFDPASPENQFGENPLLFGARVNDVLDGAAPALGESHLALEFANPFPGAPLPDLEQLLFAPEPGQELFSIHFEAKADGEFVTGASGKVHVIEVGIFDNGFHGALADGFPAEFIHLIQD